MIEIRDLNIVYKNKNKIVHAVTDANLTLKENESVGIVGESGSGKSTLAHAILQILPEGTRVDGNIFYRGVDLLKLSPKEFNEYRWQKIAMVFQASMDFLSPVHKIGVQLTSILNNFGSYKKAEAKKIIVDALKMVNLPDYIYDKYPHELSGGMMQRVAIATAFLLKPELVIMDEATTALDIVTERQIMDEILELEAQTNITRLMITHDVSLVASSVKRVVVMYGGRIVEVGDVMDVFTKPFHPYTELLLNSYPDMYKDKEKLVSIPGTIVDLSVEHKGCIFKDRCPYRSDICENETPRTEVFGDRQVACFNKRNFE